MLQSQVARVAANLDEYYEACIRNGWYLPARKSGMITRDYLDKVSRFSAALTMLL